MAAVTPTDAAVRTIEQLQSQHGSVVLHLSGGCCEGSAAMCVHESELPPGPNDIELGRVADVPFLIDRDQYERWGRPEFVLDVAPGASDSFSLEGPEGVHFVTRPPSGSADQASASISPFSSA